METFTLPDDAYPAEYCSITMLLMMDVTNAAELQQRLITASKMSGSDGERERANLDFAFLDGSMIGSVEHVLTAAHAAILNAARGNLHTQTIHSELIDNLNPTSNIGEGLRRFGVNAKSGSVLAVRIGPVQHPLTPNSLQGSLHDILKGNVVPLSQLQSNFNKAAVQKIYKYSSVTPLDDDMLITYTALNKTVGVFT